MLKITSETMHDFAEKIEYGKKHFIPMLPFVRIPYHNFDKYKTFSEKGIYLIDYVDDEYCLYHLYHLTPGDDTLRATLILPSNWNKRFEIIEKSIPNLKEWFLREDDSKKFIIQSLEYGEIEYFPTLSHYLIPTIIKNGFNPKYRMYMKLEDGETETEPTPIVNLLNSSLRVVNFSEEMLEDVIDFYYRNESTKNYQYFTNCTFEEFIEMFKQEFTTTYSKFILDAQGKIVAGILPTRENDKIWIDNFTVHPAYSNSNVGEYLLNQALKKILKDQPNETICIYLNRDCYEAVEACEKNGFTSFEFWTDMILEK
ncbi:GNAT family N-acetyltransferase [Alkaliphilus transvaalensis]|uniref:GNAT family N-acetyltransferase n=1 Tax=Alkaliphilus transvaalensis TaxID=114628 RepID=UPI00047BAFA1|nr:GNAT family N-acetyltransferase [Alkaliphilus transvaalensis]